MENTTWRFGGEKEGDETRREGRKIFNKFILIILIIEKREIKNILYFYAWQNKKVFLIQVNINYTWREKMSSKSCTILDTKTPSSKFYTILDVEKNVK